MFVVVLIAAVFCNLAVAGLWFLLLTRLDVNRKRKGRPGLLAGFFLAGFLSLIPTELLYRVSYGFWGSFPGLLDLSVIVDELFITGPVEEFSKFIVFFLVSRRLRSLREPLDGLLQAAAVGLAFATAENLKYCLGFGLQVLPLRATLCVGGHLFYAAIWGYVYAAALYPCPGESPRGERRLAFLAVAPAAIIHALYNVLVTSRHIGLGVLVDLGALGLAAAGYRSLLGFSPYAAIRGKDPARALEATSLGLLWDPASLCLQHRASLLRLHRGEHDQALVHLHACLSLLPQHPYYLGLRGITHLAAGRVEEGAAVIETAWPRSSRAQRRTLVANARSVLAPARGRAAGEGLTLGVPLPEISGELRARYPHTYEVVQRIAGRRALPTPRAGRRVPLTRRRYLLRVA